MKVSKTKLFSFLLGLLLVKAVGIAQVNAAQHHIQIGIKAGPNFSNLYAKDAQESIVLTRFNAGFFAKFPITKTIAVQPEIDYSEKGATLIYTTDLVTGTARYQLKYIEIPVLIYIRLSEHFNFQVGPYGAYLLDAKRDRATVDFENNSKTTDYSKYDFGILAGIGIDDKHWGFGIRYNYGLTQVGKEQTYNGISLTIPDSKNSVTNLYLAYTIN
jgi:hypothetical protein